MLSRFDRIPERNGRTDRIAISISRVSMLTRDKNVIGTVTEGVAFILFIQALRLDADEEANAYMAYALSVLLCCMF